MLEMPLSHQPLSKQMQIKTTLRYHFPPTIGKNLKVSWPGFKETGDLIHFWGQLKREQSLLREIWQ